MSQLRIEHTTVYSYRQPVTFGQHRLVLRPREGHDVRVDSMKLDIAPGHHLIWARDVYNNSVVIVDFLESAARLEVRSTVTIERSVPFPRQELHQPFRVTLPVEYDVLEIPVASVYQTVSYIDDLNDVRLWLRQSLKITNSKDAENMLLALCQSIHSTFKYQRRYSKGVQTPAQTLKMGSGSCRDLATLMMDAARSLGLAARFVSGYLDCPASEAGRASMHAWTEVYLPILGWRGFDPTLGEAVSLKHIFVAASHHPRGVMPVSGLFTGLTSDFLEMTAHVKIDRLEQPVESRCEPGDVSDFASQKGSDP